jgi:hypothetical protein
LRPRYYIKPYLSVRARLDLTTEWLNAEETKYARQALFGDLWTEMIYEPPKFHGIDSVVGVRAVWGTSIEAQAQTSVVQLGPVAAIGRTFDTRIGTFDVRLGMYGLGNIVKSTSPTVDLGYSCQTTAETPLTCSTAAGPQNNRFSLITSIGGKYSPIPQLTLWTSFLIIDRWRYPVPEQTLTDPMAGTFTVGPDLNDTRFLQQTWFLAAVDWDVTKWMTLTLGYYTLRLLTNPDGTYGNPFYHQGGNTRIFLTSTFALDHVYEAIRDRVRASRAKKNASVQNPFGTF